MAAEVNGLKKAIARIKDLEAQVGERTYELACEYAVLESECGSFKKAAKIADAHGLSYAHHNHMKKLVLWGEFVNAVKLADGGGATAVAPPSEFAMRSLLNDHYWSEAGPGGLAELWVTLEIKKPNVFVKAAQTQWPRATAPKATNDEGNEAITAIRKVIKATTPQIRRIEIGEFVTGIRGSKTLAEDLYNVILAKWKTWDAFVADVEDVKESRTRQAAMLASATKSKNST